jgi:hypothetical protein
VRTATMGSQIVKEDVSVAISRLDSAIESISKQLKNVVSGRGVMNAGRKHATKQLQ